MTVVVGYVPSPEGEAAFRVAIEEATVHREFLIVVTSAMDRQMDRDEREEASLRVKRSLDERELEYRLVAPESSGSVSDDLVRAAEESDARLIVIGLRVSDALGKTILGSKAQKTLAKSPCPVLTVKA